MDRGRGRFGHSRGRNSQMRWSPRPSDQSKNHHNQVVGHGLAGSNAFPVKDGKESLQQISGRSFPQSPGPQLPSHYNNQPSPSCVREDGSYNVTSPQLENRVPDASGSCSEEYIHTVASESATKVIPSSSAQSGSANFGTEVASGGISNCGTLHTDVSNKLKVSELQSKTELPEQTTVASESATKVIPSSFAQSSSADFGTEVASGGISNCGTLHTDISNKLKVSELQSKTELPEQTGDPALVDRFDICAPKESGTIVLKPSLLVKNRERRNETKRNMDTVNGTVLRPGMILLKGYISLSDQVKIVKKCRDLGLGTGGFYQPGYREGTKLHLRMMCLGKNWDPQTKEYGEHRPFDGAKPPSIPDEFRQITEKAMRDSYVPIKQDSKTGNPEVILPGMSPDICLVNFYSQNGRLGLHQDKDESEESLRRGLPVVSFSIGDSADFLYGDERDVDMAQKVVLQSGDVLIFGGKSRNIFHGVTVIHPNTAPKLLLEGTNLRPGRLNLTFRQY